MKVKHFDDTDTLYMEHHDDDIAELKHLNENTTLDIDTQRKVCAITFEYTNQWANVRHLTVEDIAA